MPILRLVAEGVGPFEKLDLDLSDGQGNPHLGPHILAGINGSGKSTVLKTIAWVLDREGWGFDRGEWKHSLAGHSRSTAEFSLKTPSGDIKTRRPTMGWGEITYADLITPRDVPPELSGPVAAYAPSPKLKYLPFVDTTKLPSHPLENALAFGETVRNDWVQAWMANLLSRPAIARETRQPAEKYEQALARFESALGLIYKNGKERLHLVPVLEPGIHPELEVGNQRLNFSQLPDGIRATIGWLSDFMMRQDLMQWDPQLEGKRPGLLLLDEIDAHLHPQWQRTLLPAIRKALPDVQIIVTSHSPFVINSCSGSRVHVFDRDENGHAYLKHSCDAPVGDDVTTTTSGIFGIESRFDVATEHDLDEWNELKRMEAVGRLGSDGAERLAELSRERSRQSDLLKSLVGEPAPPASKRKHAAGRSRTR